MEQRRITPAMNNEDSPVCTILDELGYVLFERLQDALGGLDIKVPKNGEKLADDHVLVRALGREDAEALCDLVGGETFYVPFGKLSPNLDAVEHELRAGTGNIEIARKLGISERHVRRLKQQLSDLARHPDRLVAAE